MVAGFSENETRALIAEFIGTTMFIYIGTFVATLGGSNAVASLAFGLGLAVVINAIADVSGGHVNPAVTLSLIISKHITPRLGVAYMIAQFAGGILGSAFTRISLGPRFGGGVGSNQVVDGFTDFEAFVAEALFTSLLVFTVFSVAVKDSPNAGAGAIAPYYIGLIVLVAHCCTINITNTSINPARSLGPAVIQGHDNTWEDIWIFILAPFCGSAIGVGSFWAIHGTVNPSAVKGPEDGNYDLDGAAGDKKPASAESADSVAH